MLVKANLALALLLRSSQNILSNWERGDLAAAVRALTDDIEVGVAVFNEAEKHLKKRRT